MWAESEKQSKADVVRSSCKRWGKPCDLWLPGPSTDQLASTWELIRNAEFQAPPRSTQVQSILIRCPGQFLCATTSERHYLLPTAGVLQCQKETSNSESTPQMSSLAKGTGWASVPNPKAEIIVSVWQGCSEDWGSRWTALSEVRM